MKVIKNLLTIAAASFLMTGCSKFGDTNVNPNGTTTPSTAALLSNVESALGGIASQTRGGLYAQYFSETQYTETSLYSLPRLDYDGTYSGILFDLANIIDYNTDPGKIPQAAKFGSANNQIAIARILKAYIMWDLTDRWGDLPYSEAFQGKANMTPKYDSQESIYKALVKELTEASEQFDAGRAPDGDFLYKGDAAKWKKLANSLRMLITLRTTKVYPNSGGWAATEFAAAYNDADGYISANADNLTLNYPGTAAFRNPWFNLYNGRTDFAESKKMVDTLTTYGDPRQAQFGSSNVGFPYGLTRDNAVDFANNNSTYARILSAANKAAAAPVVVVAAAHVHLAIAEAALRGWIPANVEDHYKKGITASWNQWGIATDPTSYIGGARVVLTSGNPLEKIQMQQYLAYYPNGSQAWANWRRTGIPVLSVPANASLSAIPRRYTYGSRAYSLNKENTNTAVSTLAGGDEPLSECGGINLN